MYKVLVVEDQRMPRENMENIIAASDNYDLVNSISSAELSPVVCSRNRVDLVLMDIVTIGNKNGIEASKEIKAHNPKIKIIIVTSTVEAGHLELAKEAGVDSFWYKDISKENLIDVMDRTMAGEKVYPDKVPNVKLGLANSDELTAKEIQVLRLVCDGMEYDEMADALGVSLCTVKYHISNILSKTGYANKTRLAIAVTNQTFIIPNLPEDKE